MRTIWLLLCGVMVCFGAACTQKATFDHKKGEAMVEETSGNKKKDTPGGSPINYENAMKIMGERFGKDSLIAIATTDGKRLYNRIVDAYYENGAFYVSTSAASNKMKHIAINPEVAIGAVDWFSGHGVGKNLGWVLEPQNAEIRAKLRKAFVWYDSANNEQDKNCIILEIRLTDGMLIKDHHAIRYQIDFSNESALLSENWGAFV